MHFATAPTPWSSRSPTTGAADGSGNGTGNGLVGMRERAAIVGGELDAGPRAEGGFAVRAALPYDSER